VYYRRHETAVTTCVIFGGAGVIGTQLARHLLASRRFDRVHLADIRPSTLVGAPGITTSATDVREPIPVALVPEAPQWIFHFAAVHREPGHEPHEYFDTNLPGARNVVAYAEAVACANIYFTSSISVYGPTNGPTSEASRICPNTAYGSSKYAAELIHEAWQSRDARRRLVISRPGVVYGPGDPGNILRMIRAIQRGYFAYPGPADIRKSYAYIYGLLDSIDFTMARTDPLIVYNYVESPTQPLSELVAEVKVLLHSHAPVLRLPQPLLLPAAAAAQALLGSRNPIHPTRVRKAAMSTHIVPGWLERAGFPFQYPFRASLEHWRGIAPEDFGT
jgi:nucleoside-diphosphate-sugar epimerase